jgi:hypothetical protein
MGGGLLYNYVAAFRFTLSLTHTHGLLLNKCYLFFFQTVIIKTPENLIYVQYFDEGF